MRVRRTSACPGLITANVTSLRHVILLGLSLLLAACSGPGYYLQAFSGQWKLMHARQDIDTLIDSPDTSPELVAQLQTASAIIEFAETKLALPANGSYTSYVALDKDAVTWNVVATEEFSLQAKKWCFPVAGCVPYRGFFDQQKANSSAEKLAKKGMDVFVSPVPAYSTLGKLKDPLLSTMFTGSDLRLAAYLFHELAHQRLYLKGDGRFNENYASFVEEAGLRAWLETRQQPGEIDQLNRLNRVEEDFSALIAKVREELTTLYQASDNETLKRKRKADTLKDFKDSYDAMVNEQWDNKDYYPTWFEKPLNNARLALFNTYEGGQCAFQNLMRQAGEDMEKFHDLAEKQAELPEDERGNWLKQACPVIAPASKL